MASRSVKNRFRSVTVLFKNLQVGGVTVAIYMYVICDGCRSTYRTHDSCLPVELYEKKNNLMSVYYPF